VTLTQSLTVIFLIIGFGMACERKKVLNQTQIEGFEIFLFKILMPCYLFTVAFQYDLDMLLDTKYSIGYLSSFVAIALLVISVFYKQLKSSALCIHILASSYVNAAIYALPVITFLLKNPTAGVLGNLLQVIVIQPIFIIMLNFIYHKEKSLAKKFLHVLSTPIIVLPLIGLICNYLQMNLPMAIVQVLKSLGEGAPGIALFSFGLTVGNIKLSKKLMDKHILSILFFKNILHPVMAFCIGKYILELDTYWLYSLVIATSSPTAYVIYLIAKQFSIEAELLKKVVALSAIMSLGTLLLIACYLRYYEVV
jgi:malonate transporter